MTFTLFPNLPEDVRLRIWGHVASIPRVVEIHEGHAISGTIWNEVTGRCQRRTVIGSRTRPPAMLAVCREARKHGLTIYVAAYEDLNTKPYSWKFPIYVNPAVDITYRDHPTSYLGDAFQIRCREWDEDKEPVCVTKRLAVDVSMLKSLRHVFLPGYLPSGDGRIRRYAEEVLICAQKGVEEIIIVVGNSDNLAEFSLVPLETCESQSYCAIQAQRGAELLRVATSDLLASRMESSPSEEISKITAPVIKVMTVQRRALKQFSLFPKLPYELQDLVWKFACDVPRVLQVFAIDDGDFFWMNARQSALFSVCHASREVVTRRTKLICLPGHDPKMAVRYNPMIDTIHLPYFCDYKKFAKLGIRKVGISFHWRGGDFFGGADVKKLGNVEEIVILVGQRRAQCEMTLNEDVIGHPGARFFSYELQHDMEKTARRWRTYQRAREKKGKNSANWHPPIISVGKLQHISETVIPYEYKLEERDPLMPIREYWNESDDSDDWP